MESATVIIIMIVVLIILFLIFREVNAWYWKINERIEIQNKTNMLLEKIQKQLAAQYNSEVLLNNPQKDIQNPTPEIETTTFASPEIEKTTHLVSYGTDHGKIDIELEQKTDSPTTGNRVFQNGQKAPNGKYKLGFMWYVRIEDGIIREMSLI